MSILRVITGLWRNTEETSERAKDRTLKTRYYKETYERVLNHVLEIVKNKLNWNVVHVDRERGEVMAETKGIISKYDVTISVFRVSPSRTAIDVVSAKQGGLGDLGQSYRNITSFFQALEKVLKEEE